MYSFKSFERGRSSPLSSTSISGLTDGVVPGGFGYDRPGDEDLHDNVAPTQIESQQSPDPLGINAARSGVTSATPLSAFVTARKIERLENIEYPDGVRSPKKDLNKDAKDGKFRYDREFLMQFMPVCKERPPNLPPLDFLSIGRMDPSTIRVHGGSGRHQKPASTMSQAQGSVGLEITNNSGTELGATPSLAATSQFSSIKNKRVRSKRKNAKVIAQPPAGSGLAPSAAVLEPVAPFEISTSVASDTTLKVAVADADFPEVVVRKVRALLNKLTTEKFNSISDQIIALANRGRCEKDGRTLILVTRLVFAKVIHEAARNEMYARLCRKMMEQISSEVQDDGVRTTEGKPITGGQLFRKYLLNCCQEDFERGWVVQGTTAAAKASDVQAVRLANERNGDKGELHSDGYYGVQKARDRHLGLIKFIGELFKLQMLTERIMHEYIKKLLGNVENPEGEEIESLCQLLKIAGQLLDVPKARAHMDVYFTRMKELCKSPNVSPRMQFMLQDVIELRDRKWVARGAVIAPTTISAAHEAAAKEKAAAEAQNHRQHTISRDGLRRGGDWDVESRPDSWTRPQPRAGDLSQFGKLSKAAPMVMGPSSVFTKKDKKRDSLSRTSLNSNMFSMLSQNPELAVDTNAKSSQPPCQKPSVDPGQGGAPEPQRKKLQLLPHSRPTPTKKTAPFTFEDGPKVPVQMTAVEARKKIDEDAKEFFTVRNMKEADSYFTNLPEEHRFHLVDRLSGYALEGEEADAVLVAAFFAQAASKGQCSPDVFEAGFTPIAKLLDGVAIDASNAFKCMAIMLKGAGFDKDKERLARLASKSINSDKLLRLMSS